MECSINGYTVPLPFTFNKNVAVGYCVRKKRNYCQPTAFDS